MKQWATYTNVKNNLKILVACVGLSLSIFLVHLIVRTMQSRASAQSLADSVLKKCSSDAYRPACYEKEIPKLMQKVPMEKALEVAKIVQDADKQFLYCHTTAHALSFAESKNSNGKWKDVLLRCPFAICNYGCLHGALIAQFRDEHLTDAQVEEALPDFSDICEPRTGFNPSPIDRTMCYHGMGHLAMYITDGKPEKALSICERVAYRSSKADFRKPCVEGIFMTVFQSIDPEDLALVIDIKPQKEDVDEFCSKYAAYWTSCRREAFALFYDEIQTPEGLVTFCSYAVDEESAHSCHLAVMNVLTDRFFTGADGRARLQEFCSQIPLVWRKWCYAGSATRLVQVDPGRYIKEANAICAMPATGGDRDYCYKDLLSYAKFTYGEKTKKYSDYCEALSSPWNEACHNQGL